MLRLLLIVGGCFAVGYWLMTKLVSNGGKSFHDSMADPLRSRSASGPTTVTGEETVTLSNWHLVLGVDANASKDDVKAAYKRQMSLYHPDKVSSLGADIRAVAEARAKQINAAYDLAVRYGYAS